MNTQIESTLPVAGIPATVPAAPAGETLVDIPSLYITGAEDRKFEAFAHTLTPLDMRCIFEELRDMVENDSRGDIDGEHYELDYKVYRIETVHHYECHQERGGDSYCGIWEMVPVVDEDRIEVVRIYDEDGIDYPQLVEQLNDYAKNNNKL